MCALDLCVLAAGCTLALVLIAQPLGFRPHQFKERFAEPCIAEPCEKASLKEPAGVAVDEASGNVYVVDKGANRVARFSATGEFQSEFNGSGLLGGEEHAAGSLGRAGEEETGRFKGPETIAVDNSCVLRKRVEPTLTQEECEAQDPSNGDVYVVDAGNGVIDKYSSKGEYIGQITEAAVDGVAVDQKGRVWIYQQEGVGSISGYTNATPNEFTVQMELHFPEFPGFSHPGFAVDSKGDFYARYGKEGGGRIAKIDPSGKVLNAEVSSENTSSVAVNQSNDNVLLDHLTSIEVLDSEGTFVERLGEEDGAKHLSAGTSIGVNAGSELIYAADPGAGDVALFGPSHPSAPKVESESLADVSSNSASLGAQINPRSEVGEEPTEYHFQYGRCATATSCQGSAYEANAPAPDGQIAADFEIHGVSVKLEGLAPSTTYHFRAIAKNSHGEGEAGEERSFTTQSAGGELALPDNRGWELVSPPDKQGSLIEPISETGVIQAAGGGGAITYLANAPTEAAPQGYTNKAQALSSRGAAAWSSRDIATPHAGATGFSVGAGAEDKFFSPELTSSAVQPFGPFDPALSEEASEPTAFLHDLSGSCASHCFHPLVTGKAGFANVPEGTRFGEAELCEATPERQAQVFCGPEFLGASEDLSHIVLLSNVALKPGAGAGQLYEWAGGALSQVSVLPGGAPAPASSAGLGTAGSTAARGAISSDGARVVWVSTLNSTSNLYVRDMARGETLQVDKAEVSCGGCESGGGQLQIASADGSRIFFTDTNRLSEDAGAKPTSPLEADLYECRVVLEEGKLACELSDLTPKQGAEGADVQGSALGASEDGSYIYYVAKGVQSQAPNALGQSASAGKFNLYVRHGASSEFIATLAGGDEHDWSVGGGVPAPLASQPTRVSASGQFLELMSEASLSGYDNRDLATGEPVAEVYLYDAGEKRLSCASCVPTGARPAGVEYHKLEPISGGLAGAVSAWRGSALVAANVPGWTAFGLGRARHQPRYLTDAGRLFFNSADALVPQDANGTEDVYEYEPPGVGDCSEALPTYSARAGGCVSLISSGRSAQESAFMDASESGDDVFFLTAAELSPLDVDAALDIYDAHHCTSAEPCITFAGPQPPPCTNEASCKASPTPQPSIFGAPASATFSGPGNAPPPPPKQKTAEEIRIEHLNKALKSCRAKKNKHKRKACEKRARKRYAKPKAKAKKAHKAKRPTRHRGGGGGK